MAFSMPPPALPPGLPGPREALPVESAYECSDSDDCDDFHGPDDWDGQPWEVVFPSDSPLLTTTYESSDGLFDALKEFCIENRMGIITLRSQKDKAKTRTIKYELVCDKSRYNPRESTAKIRNTTTTKLAANCPVQDHRSISPDQQLRMVHENCQSSSSRSRPIEKPYRALPLEKVNRGTNESSGRSLS